MINSTSLDFAIAEGKSATGWISNEDHDRVVSEAHAEGVRAGVIAERDRFLAVMGSEHYAGRDASALTMLTTTDMTAEAIFGVLARLPAAAPPAAPTLPSPRSQDAVGGLVLLDAEHNAPQSAPLQ